MKSRNNTYPALGTHIGSEDYQDKRSYQYITTCITLLYTTAQGELLTSHLFRETARGVVLYYAQYICVVLSDATHLKILMYLSWSTRFSAIVKEVCELQKPV